jgi:pimeloyl-ACP methyl ester carboxylesterase
MLLRDIMNININGLNIEYTDVGEGAPILLLHGWGSSFKFYENIIKNQLGNVIVVDNIENANIISKKIKKSI